MTPPHTLILVKDDQTDPAEPLAWTHGVLLCPHQPPTADMPCASLGARCGCPENDDGSTGDDEPCPNSPTGLHHYWDGEPWQVIAECWPIRNAHQLAAATPHGLGPGSHPVWPISEEDGRLALLRTDPDARRAVKADELRERAR